jgi:hypothetical protein
MTSRTAVDIFGVEIGDPAMRRVQAPWLTLALVALSQGTAAHTHALLRPNL